MEEAKSMKQTMFPVPNYEDWKMAAEKSLKGKPFEKLYTNTYEGIMLKPLYTKEDIEALNIMDELPGFVSFVRGTDKLGYRLSPWHIAQQLEAESPQEMNAIIKENMSRGLTMINLSFNNEGVFQTVEDFKLAFDGIDLENTPVLLDAQAYSFPLFTQFLASLKDTQDLKKLSGTIGMDPLGVLVEEGTLSVSLQKHYDLMADFIAWSNENTPKLKTVLVKSNPYHNGGANAIQELACAIATAVEYINECLNRGLTIEEIARQMTFTFSIGGNLFMEAAKLRAAKMLWSAVIKEFGGNTDSQKMHIHAQTSTFTKTEYDPYVNILRGTTEAFAAIIGGVDSLSVSTFDEAYHFSSDFSRRIARNTQIILKDEAHLDKVIDPAGGSWYVESLTSEIADKAWLLFQQIEKLGGMSKALKKGFIQEKIKEVFTKKLDNLNYRKDKIVGTNFYANLKEKPFEKQERSLHEKSSTNLNMVQTDAYLTNLKEAINNKQDIIEKAIIAASSGITIHDMLKAVMEGEEPISIEPIKPQRLTSSFESLRKASGIYKTEHGHFPKVSLINLGPLSMHKARADFITGFFEAGGFEIVNNEGSNSINECLAKYNSNVKVYVICGTDDQYVEYVPGIAAALKDKNIKLFVAGKQQVEIEKQFVEAGILGFIHLKSNCYETLKDLQQEMGVQE